MSSDAPRIITVKTATPEFPRHSEPAMLERQDGTLFMIWQEFMAGGDGGQDNSPSRLSAMLSRDGGCSWGEPRVLVERTPGDVNVYSPNLVCLPDGEWLFIYFRYHTLASGQPPATSAFVCRSRDEGETFSPPVAIWAHAPLGFASGVAHCLASGRVVLPLGRQTGAIWSPTDHEAVGSMVSDDGGRAWREAGNWIDLPLRGAMEPHVAELRDGRLLMVMRTQLGAVFQAHSTDGGVTWDKPQTTGLRSPESCPELVRIPQTGDLLIAWNNAPYDPGFGSHFGKRSPLTVAVSHNDGRSWSPGKDVETDATRAFSNPVCHVTRRGTVLLLYWTCPYFTERWHMNVARLDLRAALFGLEWLYR